MNTHDQKPLPAVWEYRSWSATIAPFCVEVMRQVSCFPLTTGSSHCDSSSSHRHHRGQTSLSLYKSENLLVTLLPGLLPAVPRSLLLGCVSPTGGDCRRSPCHRAARPGRAAAGRTPLLAPLPGRPQGDKTGDSGGAIGGGRTAAGLCGERWPQHPQLASLASGPLDWAGHWPLATGLASWGHKTVTAGTLRGWRGLDTATGTQASLTRHNSPLPS